MYVSDSEKAIIENAGMAIGDLRALAEGDDLHAHVAHELVGAARLITRIEDDLRAKISTARRDLDNADAALTAGEAINERGVVQAIAPAIDILAARRADAYARFAAARRIAAALPGIRITARA